MKEPAGNWIEPMRATRYAVLVIRLGVERNYFGHACDDAGQDRPVELRTYRLVKEEPVTRKSQKGFTLIGDSRDDDLCSHGHCALWCVFLSHSAVEKSQKFENNQSCARWMTLGRCSLCVSLSPFSPGWRSSVRGRGGRLTFVSSFARHGWRV
jgi:hypothetical protein